MRLAIDGERARNGLRRAFTGLAAAVPQSAMIVVFGQQDSLADAAGLPGGSISRLVAAGTLVPLFASLLVAYVEHLGGRRIMVATAGSTLLGLIWVALAGPLVAHGEPVAARVAVVAGVLMVPAAARLGELVVLVLTSNLSEAHDRRREGAGLRRYLVLGGYLPAAGATALTDRLGIGWSFGLFAGVCLLCVVHLYVIMKGELGAPAGGAAPAPMLRDPWLWWIGANALAARATVFSFVSGAPRVLALHGHTGLVVAVVQAAATSAVLVVGRPPKRLVRFAAVSGLAALTASAALLIAGSLNGAAGIAFVVVCVCASPLFEATKQWFQEIARDQASHGHVGRRDIYRRNAFASFLGNIGQMLGTLAGPACAGWGAGSWAGLLLAGAAPVLASTVALYWWRAVDDVVGA